MTQIKQNPHIGKQVYINGEEGQVVAFQDEKYVVYTEKNTYHLDNLDNIFCPDKSNKIPAAYTQVALIIETLRLLVVPQPIGGGKFEAAIDYTKMSKDSDIREAIKCLSKAITHYDRGMKKKQHIPQESFYRVTDIGVSTIDTISLLYYALLTLPLDKQEIVREGIENMLWLTTQTENELQPN